MHDSFLLFQYALHSNKECPTCRKKLVSKRSLRADPNFDALIAKVRKTNVNFDKMDVSFYLSVFFAIGFFYMSVQKCICLAI